MAKTELAEAVISYLRKHKDAADTIEGIARWWIMRERIETDIDELAETLDSLTDEGILAKRATGPVNDRSKVVYSLNKARTTSP